MNITTLKALSVTVLMLKAPLNSLLVPALSAFKATLLKGLVASSMGPLTWFVAALTLTAAPGSGGADQQASGNEQQSAYQRVVTATRDLLTIAEGGRETFDRDPEAYYRQIDNMVGQLVDVERFSRSVMANYASVQRYRALTSEAEKRAFLARVDRFGAIIRQTLIHTYARALLGFDGLQLETLPPPAAGEGKPDYARIDQKIHRQNGAPHLVNYYLHRDPDGQWLVYNIAVDGINIGHIFRTQFAEAVEENGGDVDKAIDNWQLLQHPIADSQGES